MTAFTDYLDLRVAVVEAVADPSLTDVLDRLTLLAEVMFNRKLRCREQVNTAQITFVGGAYPVPADLVEIIGLYHASGCELIQRPLQNMQSPHDLGFYALNAGNIVIQGDREMQLEYYAKVPTLTTSLTTSNWLLEKHPDAYLYAVTLEAAKYKRDVDAANLAGSLLKDAMSDIATQDHRERYSRTRVRVAGVTP